MKTLTKFFAMAAIAVFALAACQKGDCGCEDDGTLKYGGVTYRIKTFSNGATWMVDNLCYVPEGKTVSSNPADSSGLWYPYVIENAAAKVLTDAASVQKGQSVCR